MNENNNLQETTNSENNLNMNENTNLDENINTDTNIENNMEDLQTHSEDSSFTEKPNHNSFNHKIKYVASACGLGILAGASLFGTNFGLSNLLKSDNVATAETNTTETRKTSLSIGTAATTGTVSATVTDLSDIVESAMPTIVAISGTVQTEGSYYSIPGFENFGTEASESAVSGSGIIIGQNEDELLIVTNAHVVEDVNDLTITFDDESTSEATVKGSKTSKDIAVLSVKLSDLSEDTLNSIKIATMGNSDNLKVGESAIAIGNACGYGQTVTSGIVSALDRTITIDNTEYGNLIQTDAAINPGNSGGALLDSSGNLIGINSAKVSSDSVEGIGYAIPISSVMDLIEELMNKETKEIVDKAERGTIGIYGTTITDDIASVYGYPNGVYVSQIIEDTGAASAGLYQGDIIYEINGEDIMSMDDIQQILQYYKEGETISISYYRLTDGDFVEKTTDVKLQKTTESTENTKPQHNK